MNVSLPALLEEGIAESLKALPSSQWVRAAQSLSLRYRADRAGSPKPLARGSEAILGYAALILPATYAQLWGAMAATSARVPGWKPISVLDIGSGPGTALWAAVSHWPGLQTLVAWEREEAFIELGQQLARPHPQLSRTEWRRVTLGSALPPTPAEYDLIVIGHVLNELQPDLQREVVRLAWEMCRGVLLIVEPGTSAAFPVVQAARAFLLEQGAETLAPCTHDAPCPLLNDWCHFPQRLNRPTFQRRAKGAVAGWEESKFSYTAMARFGSDKPAWGRLIHQPNVQKGQVALTISSRDGIVRPVIAKRNREAFKVASEWGWGELLPAPLDSIL